MPRPQLPTTEEQRQFECVARVYYRLQQLGELSRKPKVKGFHLEAWGKDELGLDEIQIRRSRARARTHVEKLYGKIDASKAIGDRYAAHRQK